MGATTGPVLAAGGITIFNRSVLNDGGLPLVGAPSAGGDPGMLRVILATAIAAGGLRLWEEFMPRTATAVAWLALMTTLLVRVEPGTPAPLETLSAWYNTGRKP